MVNDDAADTRHFFFSIRRLHSSSYGDGSSDVCSSDLVAANGALTAGGSTVSVAGNVNLAATTAYITSSSGGAWTVSGSWTDGSSSASWSFAAPITFRSAASQTMTWGGMSGNEFGGAVTFDSSVAGGVTFTSAGNALRIGGALTVQNSTGG